MIRHDWTTEQVEALYHLPLTELLFRAQTVHRQHHDPDVRSALHAAEHQDRRLSRRLRVLSAERALRDRRGARRADGPGRRAGGGAHRAERTDRRASAWARRGAKCTTAPRSTRCWIWCEDVAALGMEVCTTLGMLTAEQAQRLKSAGLTAYNHNLDTSPEFYPKIITTRTYQDRLDTLQHVQDAGLSVCCGGIIGMGESSRDRCAMLAQLGRLDPHPGEPAGERARAHARHAAGRCRRSRSDRARAHDRLRASRRTEGARAVVGRAARAVGRSAGVVFRCGRQLDLLRREAADLAKSGASTTISS